MFFDKIGVIREYRENFKKILERKIRLFIRGEDKIDISFFGKGIGC